MPWFLLAAITAACETGRDLLGKRGVRSIDPLVVAFLVNAGGAVALAPLAAMAGMPGIGPPFWGALVIVGALNTLAVSLYLIALRDADVSLAVPMIAFTPLLMVGLGPGVLGERPTPVALAGMILVVVGAYVLRLDQRRHGLLAPFKALVRERGPRLMLIVALLFSVTSTFDKVGVRASAPLFWVTAVHAFGALALAPFALPRFLAGRRRGERVPARLYAIGLLSAGGNVAQMLALPLTVASYVIAVKRLSVALTVVAGHLLFGERGFRDRLAGATLMVLGVALICAFGV
jgi:drug/metabolite transporter (DMT)-like permease